MVRNPYFISTKFSLLFRYISNTHTHTRISDTCVCIFLAGKKIKLGSAKRRRGWNQIWGLVAITLCLIASLNGRSTGTCLDRFRQLVKTHESSAGQKVTFPCGVHSLKVVVLYVCYFHCENTQGEGQKACMCHYSTSHLCGFGWPNWIAVSVVMSASPLDMLCVDLISQVGDGALPRKPVPSAVWPGSFNSDLLQSL